MSEEKFYVLEDGTELVIIEKINYYGVNYMLLKNSKSTEIRIAYEYNGNLIYIKKDEDNYQEIAKLLLEKVKETLEQ